MSTYGSHPEQATVKLTLGDGAHLVATSANGWAGPVSLVWGPDDGQWTEETSTLTDVGTVNGTEVSWTLTVEQVTARSAFPYVRLVDNGMTLEAGEVIPWTGGLGSTVTQTIASLTAGPPGPTAVSADPDNLLKIGSDNLLMLDPDDLPAGGGDTTVQIGTVTLPESPTVGLSVSVLADSDTVLPEDVTWDSGGAPTITERMLLVFVWSGDDWVGTYGPSIPDAPIPPDETGPTAGTLGVVVDVTSADGTVTGAADETELHAAPYSFRIDSGTWSAYQAGATYEWTGLDPATEYDFQHRVRDAAGNVTEGAVVTDTTDADVTGPTAGTLGVAPGVTTADLTVTGASDDIALHATPYAYSTDNGSTWSAYQAGATYEATGLTSETEYTFRHKVRDAAGNETLGTAVVDSTEPDPTDVTPPTPGTLAASAITSSGFTLTVTGASDDEALHGTPYRFSTDDGVTYSAWQAGATFDATALDPETEYTCIHQVRDAALNVATGSSILVETEAEASGWTPADLPSLAGWWDASDSATVTESGGLISQITDKSGAGNHMTQATEGSRPSTGTLNGLGCVTIAAAKTLVSATSASGIGALTVFSVHKFTTFTNFHDLVRSQQITHGYVSSTVFRSAVGSNIINATLTRDTSPHVFTSRRDGADSVLRIDGTEWTGDLGTAGTSAPSHIGSQAGTGTTTGQVGEVFICNAAVSETDIALAEAYLAAKWGIA